MKLKWNGSSFSISRAAFLVFLLLSATVGFCQSREEILEQAVAYWPVGAGIAGTSPPLSAVGDIQFRVPAEGPGATVGAEVARLNDAYFNAGSDLNVTGNRITVFLRARDPLGLWQYALVAKRGSHDIVNFNLFSVDLGGTPGSDIGFEIRTEQGFAMVSFPLWKTNPSAWLNLVARYDGKEIELICNNRVMARQSWTGNLTSNSEPLLIGAETDGGDIVRPFSGDIEEVAIWDRALEDHEIADIVRATTLHTSSAQMLHYKHPAHAVGDVHPYFEDGVYYVTYLYNPGTWNVAQIRSTDLLHWEWYELTHEPATGGQLLPNYFVLDIIRDPALNKYRTYYGYAGTRTSVSEDLLHWDFGVPHLVMPDSYTLYDRQSDPFVFWNEDENKYWMVQTLRKKNLPHSQAGAVGYAVANTPTSWTFQGELYFPGDKGDPEVPSMFKMGDQWYLLASYSDRAVGKPSYRYSSNPRGPWNTPFPDSLDGKDLCAAISCENDTTRLLFGWIPLTPSQPGSQYWGGHLAFPREVYQLAGRETLGTRLESSIGEKIRGPLRFPAGGETLLGRAGTWSINGNEATCLSTSGYNVATISGLSDRIDLELRLTPNTGCQRAGAVLDWSPSSVGLEVGVDVLNSRFLIQTPGGLVHSEIPIELSPLNRPNMLRVIVEGNIVEAFLDDRYSLAARVPLTIQASVVGLFSQGGPVLFENVNLFYLNGLNELPDIVSAVPQWTLY